jgi:multimeric flavodoxin WrbA
MKVIAVMGSPREEGRSNAVIREFIRGAKDAGHEVLEYNVNKMNIVGCQACGTCKKGKGCDCIQQDDLRDYWKELHGAGALIVGAPNYAGNVCGQMITYMNRHYCLLDKDWKPTIRPGIKVFGVFSQGNSDKKTYKKQYKHFMADFENRKMKLKDLIVCAGGDGKTPDKETMERAYEDGRKL